MRVSRVMRADSRPVAYLVDTLPEDVLHAEELTGKFNGSVLDYLLQRGDPLTISRADISAINATADVAKMLEIQRDDVLVAVCGQAVYQLQEKSWITQSVTSCPGISNSMLFAVVGCI